MDRLAGVVEHGLERTSTVDLLDEEHGRSAPVDGPRSQGERRAARKDTAAEIERTIGGRARLARLRGRVGGCGARRRARRRVRTRSRRRGSERGAEPPEAGRLAEVAEVADVG